MSYNTQRDYFLAMTMTDTAQASGSRHDNCRCDTQDSSDTVKPLHFQQPSLRPHEPIPLVEQTSLSLSRLSHLDTPAARTGPPRSLSFAHGLPGSPTGSIRISRAHHRALSDGITVEDDEFHSVDGMEFRGPLEVLTPEDRQLGKGKKRERESGWRTRDDSWDPRTWFHESSKEGNPPVLAENGDQTNTDENNPRRKTLQSQKSEPFEHTVLPLEPIIATSSEITTEHKKQSLMRRAFSLPHRLQDDKDQKKGTGTSTGHARWARLRALLPQIIHSHGNILPGPSVITSHAVNITDELITGGLSTLMLKLWFERDEKDHRRVPILLHRLRIRVSDSLHPLHGHKSVFRIECEYANGAAKWVVYRQLIDFLSLHAHYKVSNVYNRNVDNMPEFPKTSAFLSSFLYNQYIFAAGRFAIFQVPKKRGEGKG